MATFIYWKYLGSQGPDGRWRLYIKQAGVTQWILYSDPAGYESQEAAEAAAAQDAPRDYNERYGV